MLKNLKILVVEDDEIGRLLLKEQLGKEVAEIDFAKDGREAYTKIFLRHQSYDLAIIDLSLPHISGDELIILIRRNEKNTDRHLPVIVHSGYAFEAYRKKALLAGADDYLIKPYTKEALMEKIHSFTKKPA